MVSSLSDGLTVEEGFLQSGDMNRICWDWIKEREKQ
jgi:hypothetical protein